MKGVILKMLPNPFVVLFTVNIDGRVHMYGDERREAVDLPNRPVLPRRHHPRHIDGQLHESCQSLRTVEY